MPDLNRESLEIWNSLKPMVDEEIKSQTRGAVQRRKAKVTTVPSLSTNKIGVTEPYCAEIFIPFVSNLISATVGDYVWIEFAYGATNAYASMFASSDHKDETVAGNLHVIENVNVDGVLDVTPRRCYASLSSEGWYRVFDVTNGLGKAGSSFSISLNIGRAFNSVGNELHSITLLANYNSHAFSSEVSKTNALGISAVRYTVDGSNNGHIDIYYGLNNSNFVYADFDVHCRPQQSFLIQYNAVNFTTVAASPSGETVLTEYTFAENTEGLVTNLFTTSKGSVLAYRSGNMVTVTFWGNSTTWTEDEVFMTVADGAKPALSYLDVTAYIGRQAVVVRINQSGNISLWIGSTLTGNQRLYFSATYPILH